MSLPSNSIGETVSCFNAKPSPILGRLFLRITLELETLVDRNTLKIRGYGVFRWTTEQYYLTLRAVLRRPFFRRRKTRAEDIPKLLSDYLSQFDLQLEDRGTTQGRLSPSEFDFIVTSSSYITLRKVGHALGSGDILPHDVMMSAYLGSIQEKASKQNRLRAMKEAFYDAQGKAQELAKLLEKPLLDAISIKQVSDYDDLGYRREALLSEPAKEVREETCLEVIFRLGEPTIKAA